MARRSPHRDGLTLGPNVGDTFALVEAKGASGAGVRGGQGARVDGNGYALVPSLSPYRYNPICLDPARHRSRTPNCWRPSARSRPTPALPCA